ncbi:hypothetical protein BD410DRAFT_784778 [Rickenella mellea]|uniref:Uncharacterized protein n=1 Tax=Rickenella mellea TaxID=50990 RepID=A0A4Y7QDH3_9AGAM|nr:hypothetical protein BD410DRAFT_784778 [Rickenella mellea]
MLKHILTLGIVLSTVVHFSLVRAGLASEGSPCSLANNHLDPATHKFLTDCDDRSFCFVDANTNSTGGSTVNLTQNDNASGICAKKRCRSDEFPFGFAPGEQLPPQCGTGFFCPDSGSGCTPINKPGMSCELNRDAQCSQPPGSHDLASPLNSNGSICLRSQCMYANITLGLQCILESTLYAGYGTNGMPYSITILRDNCRSPRLYCDQSSNLCERTKEIGQPCQNDKECLSTSCGVANICVHIPGQVVIIKPWEYWLTSLAIMGVMTSICTFLTLSHKRHRLARSYELLEYHHEQIR